jgi:hypothetical protein
LVANLSALAEKFQTGVRNAAALYASYLRSQHQETHNPLYVWDAYRLARATGELPPEWVFEYFDRVASGLAELERESQSGKPIRNPSAAIAEAMGMKAEGRSGAGTPFSKRGFKKDFAWVLYSSAVFKEIKNGSQETYAVEEVSRKNNISASTVWRHWRRSKRQFKIDG